MTKKFFIIIFLIFLIFFLSNHFFFNDSSQNFIQKNFRNLQESQLQKIIIKKENENLRLVKNKYWQVDNELNFFADAALIHQLFLNLTQSIFIKQKLKIKKSKKDISLIFKFKNQTVILILHGYYFKNNKAIGRYVSYNKQLYLINQNFIDIMPNLERIWYKKFLPKITNLKTIRLFKKTGIIWQADWKKKNLIFSIPKKKISLEKKQKFLNMINKLYYLTPIYAEFFKKEKKLSDFSLELITHDRQSYRVYFLKEKNGMVILKIKLLPFTSFIYDEWHFLIPKKEIEQIIKLRL